MSRRILLLVTDLEIGGTPTVVRELAIRLNKAGVDVEVASLKEIGPNGVLLSDAGIRVSSMHARSAAAFPLVVRRVRKAIQGGRFDVVLSFLVHSNVVAAMAVPQGAELFQSIQTTQPKPAWHWKAQGWAAKRAKKIIVPSTSVIDAGVERSAIPRGRFIVIPNAIDPNAFERSTVSPSPAGFPVGFIGRLDPVKRIHDLIDAIGPAGRAMPLHIYGDGPERSKLEQRAESIGAHNVEFHGAIRRPQEALVTLGALILPSEAEGFGLVLIEAMAAGVPVIATNVPGIRDVVEHEQNGLLVPVGQPAAIRAAVERVRNDVALRTRLIENGLATVRERYTWDVVLPQYRQSLGV